MMKSLFAAITKIISGTNVRWVGCVPETRQRIYFANHTSNLDALVIWASLPFHMRVLTRPVAARDYWTKSRWRLFFASQIFNAVLIERKHPTTHDNPLRDMLNALGTQNSLIIFPEGGRQTGTEMVPFKGGLFHLAKDRPDVELVPVLVENLNRILPKGEFLPVPLMGSLSFGTPIRLEDGRGQGFISWARAKCRQNIAAEMNLKLDKQSCWLVCGVLALLVIASLAGWILSVRITNEKNRATVQNLNARIRAWWIMAIIFGLALATGRLGVAIMFGLTSFLALREFITLTPTRLGDHRTLFWVFFLIVPLQYYLVDIKWYGLFSILIPVFAFLFIPIRSAMAADCGNFLERTAKIQWALMICVYCVSYVPALLCLDIPGYAGQNGKLVFYFVLVVQISDVLQYIWGKTLGRHKIAPLVSPSKTWEGFIGGIASATLIGTALWWATPFSPLQSAGMSLVITLMGFGGGLVMSAIKRDRGVKDYGNLIEGHGGVMDRIDSLCFAAPVFFHLVRFYFT